MIRKLGRFETAQALTDQCAPFNIVVVLNFSEGPPVKRLEGALDCLQRIYSLLRTNVHQKGKEFSFGFSSFPIPFELVSSVREEHWKEIAEGELNHPIHTETGPLMRLTGLFESTSKGNKIRDIILTFHHTIMDASSLTSLLNQFLLFLGNPESDVVISNYSNSGNVIKETSEHYFPRRYHGFRILPGFFSFLFRQVSGEIRYRFQTTGLKKYDIRMDAKNRILSMDFSADFTQLLLKRSREEGTTLNHVILISMLRTVSKHLFFDSKGPFRLFLFADLRPYLSPPLEPDYLGSYFSMMRFSSPVDFQVDFWEEVRRLNRKTLKSFRRGDKFYFSLASELIMRTMIRKKNERMGTIALSFTGSASIHSSFGNVKLKNIHSFVSNFGLGPLFCAQGRMFGSKLCMDYIYLDTDFDSEEAVRMISQIRSILEEAVGR